MTLPRFSIRPTYNSNILLEEPPLVINRPADVYEFFNQTVTKDPTYEPQKEHVVVVALDTRLQLIGYNIVSVGTSNECLLRVGETLRPVIIAGSSHFFLLHNHPSGNPDPSMADRAVTRKVHDACNSLDLHFIDHVIVGKYEYYSFREHGQLH